MRLTNLTEDDYEGLPDGDNFGRRVPPPTHRALKRGLINISKYGGNAYVNEDWFLIMSGDVVQLVRQVPWPTGVATSVYEAPADRFVIARAIRAARDDPNEYEENAWPDNRGR